jgi:peptidyl-dipeptidase A
VRTRLILCIGLAAGLAGCGKEASVPPAAPAETAGAFIARANHDLSELAREVQGANFIQATDITPDTEFIEAKANDRYLALLGQYAAGAGQFAGQKLAPADARALALLKFNVDVPAPRDAARRAELTQLGAQLESMFGAAKYCPPGAARGSAACKNVEQLSEVLAKSRNYDELVAAWKGWHDIGAPMRAAFRRLVTLANEGARDSGFKDLGVMWRAHYDMSPEEFDAESERLWQQGHHAEAHGHAPDRCRRDHRVFPASYGLAHRAEQEPAVRLGIASTAAQSFACACF